MSGKEYGQPRQQTTEQQKELKTYDTSEEENLITPFVDTRIEGMQVTQPNLKTSGTTSARPKIPTYTTKVITTPRFMKERTPPPFP